MGRLGPGLTLTLVKPSEQFGQTVGQVAAWHAPARLRRLGKSGQRLSIKEHSSVGLPWPGEPTRQAASLNNGPSPDWNDSDLVTIITITMRSNLYVFALAAARLAIAKQVGYFQAENCAAPSDFESCYADADEWLADCINENCDALGIDCHNACECARQGAYTRCATSYCWNMVRAVKNGMRFLLFTELVFRSIAASINSRSATSSARALMTPISTRSPSGLLQTMRMGDAIATLARYLAHRLLSMRLLGRVTTLWTRSI
jgi:hypothetical protein